MVLYCSEGVVRVNLHSTAPHYCTVLYSTIPTLCAIIMTLRTAMLTFSFLPFMMIASKCKCEDEEVKEKRNKVKRGSCPNTGLNGKMHYTRQVLIGIGWCTSHSGGHLLRFISCRFGSPAEAGADCSMTPIHGTHVNTFESGGNRYVQLTAKSIQHLCTAVH